jgi:FAD/FMN-containing dehydrogenase
MVNHSLEPASIEEMMSALDGGSSFRIEGLGTRSAYRLPSRGEQGLALRRLNGIVKIEPENQIAVVQAGLPIRELQREALAFGLALPISDPFAHGTVGGAISMNLPHDLGFEHGSWMDWVLGAKVLLADGKVIRCGSEAVKNVAGYDLHKLLVGARGTLGILLEVVLRLAPAKSICAPQREGDFDPAPDKPHIIQRTLRSDFDSLLSGIDAPFLANRPSSTVWYSSAEPPLRFPDDWVVRCGYGEMNLEIVDETAVRLMKRAKALFDPVSKLNPGEFGIL